MSPDAAHGLAATLAPALREACEGRLGEITWFRTDWQRGGAATGISTFVPETNNGTHEPVPVVVKVPVVQRELIWTKRLHNAALESPGGSAVPTLYASGESLGDYDLAWIVIEKFDHGPLGLHWHDDHVLRIARAVASFHKAAD